MKPTIAGERFDFSPAARRGGFPEQWRDLDRLVWRWVRAHGGDASLADVAAWASYAEGEGHSALELAALTDGLLPTETMAELAGKAMVASPVDVDAGARQPFVLDGGDFYLLRNYLCEQAVGRAIAARRQGFVLPKKPLDDAELRDLFAGSWSKAEERQRAAVQQAPGRRLMVLTGGPGTGKTTTVLRMLLAMSREHEAQTGILPQVRIAAPTGKAAQRLGESLRDGAAQLRQGGNALDDDWLRHLDGVLHAEPGTVHRLLGSRGRHGGFRFTNEEPLPADIVVVDEASMLDLGLLRALLDALSAEATLVLVGDADQLTSVGTGSVMMDVVAALEVDPQGDLVRLEHCFRADLSLVPIHHAVRDGDTVAFTHAWDAAAAEDRVARHDVGDVRALRRQLSRWTRRIAETLVAADITTPVSVDDQAQLLRRLAVLRAQQLLCALREGPFGATEASHQIEQRLRVMPDVGGREHDLWYPGRCVMVVRNDPTSGLFNGDVGICVPVRERSGAVHLRVLFDPASQPGGEPGPVRLFEPNTLPAHDSAFALTVHKSQGSEYRHVAVLLPPDAQSPLLTRQTLYTALSRAKTSIELWSTPESTERAITTLLRRRGQLARRIRQ